MFWGVGISADEQKTVIGVVGTTGPDFLSIDDKIIAIFDRLRL
jgi:hypothetical protein